MGGAELSPEPLTLGLLAELDDESFDALFCVMGHILCEGSRVWNNDSGCSGDAGASCRNCERPD